MSFECLKADNRRKSLIEDWERWLREADKIYARYLDEIGDSPFTFNEISAVGFLSAAAARVGYLSLHEYECIKRDQSDRRVKKAGRADLWLNAAHKSYSFEFKRALYAATMKNLEATLSRARDDIKVIDKSEPHYASGVVLAYVRDEERVERFEKFAQHESVDFAYRIGPKGFQGGYLYFSVKS